MFWLFDNPEKPVEAAETLEKAEKQGGGAEHHMPIIVEKINHAFGPAVHQFQVNYTKPLWDRFFSIFHTDAEKVFGPYTVENAIPWYTVMFVIACILSVIVIFLFRRKLSEDEPSGGQQTLEVAVLALRNLIVDVVGPHGIQYFPVVATFGVLILVSNLLGFIPGMMSPTASTSVTFALGISSFLYYNYI